MNRSARTQNAGAGFFDLFATPTPSVVASRPEFSWLRLLAGLPCVVLAMALVGAPMVSQRRMSTWERYQWSVVANLQSGNLPAALVDLKRLLSMQPGRPELIFTMAQVYDRLGKPDWAEALALSVAPENQPGYSPARKWLVDRTARKVSTEVKSKPQGGAPGLTPTEMSVETPPVAASERALTDSQAKPSPDLASATVKAEGANAGSAGGRDDPGAVAVPRPSLVKKGSAEAIELQLKEWLAENPGSTEARMQLGLLYVEMGRYAESRELLESVAEDRPLVLLKLAQCSAGLGDREAMRRYAQKAGETCWRISITHHNDPTVRTIWSKACLVLDDYRGALDVLGGPDAPPATAARKAEMAQICLLWVRSMMKSRSGGISEVLAILQRGLAYDETNEALLSELAGLLTNSGKASSLVANALQSMISEGRAAAPARYALGMEAWNKGQAAESRRYWEQAYTQNPHIVVLANNLAWNLASTPPVDPARGLNLIDRALAERPRDGRLRMTRGSILGKLGRWHESAAELERAVAQGEKTENVQVALAEAYKHLGRSGKAAAPLKKP